MCVAVGSYCAAQKHESSSLPQRAPASYNLTQVMEQIKNNKNHPSDQALDQLT